MRGAEVREGGRKGKGGGCLYVFERRAMKCRQFFAIFFHPLVAG